MDYAHARHAGNAGDVFKHVALIALLDELLRGPEPLLYLETHAGDGLYPLGSAGEWGDGVQRLWNVREGLAGRYAEIVRDFSPQGSPRPEVVPGAQAASVLRRAVPQAEVRQSDGLAALPVEERALVLVDPPYTRKQEWNDAARALVREKTAILALWYPIKALTRPRALIAQLAREGVHGTAVELHWTPLRLKRERLNGS